MAYKSARRPVRRRRTVRKTRPTATRRSTVKRRTYRRKPRSSRKYVLNLVSRKKRDIMLPWTNSTSSSQTGGTSYGTAPAVVVGGLGTQQSACFVWCATARDLTVSSSIGQASSNVAYDNVRTASTCYMVGLKEMIQIQTVTAVPWEWRRICFTMKGPQLAQTTGSGYTISAETGNGWMRVLNQFPGDPSSGAQGALMSLLFRGNFGSDWMDPFTAPTDQTRVTVKYDKTITIKADNEEGVMRNYSRWHPMYSNLVYDDDELGSLKSSATMSVDGKAGMGDYFVIDLFRSRAGSTSTDQLLFRPQATLYWHER